MSLVSQLLKYKGYDVWSVRPEDTVLDAIRLMSEKSVGALFVMEGEQLVGVISERDYAREVVLKGRSSSNTPVRDIMSFPVIHAEPQLTVEQCLSIMTENHVRHLPVMDGPKVVGVLSIGDLVKAIITDQQNTIEHLERYISS